MMPCLHCGRIADRYPVLRVPAQGFEPKDCRPLTIPHEYPVCGDCPGRVDIGAVVDAEFINIANGRFERKDARPDVDGAWLQWGSVGDALWCAMRAVRSAAA